MNALTLSRPILAVVTERRLLPTDEILLASVDAAVAGGASIVQLREKGLPFARLVPLARKLRAVTSGRALLVINVVGVEGARLARMVDADGVQLGERALSVGEARHLCGDRMLVGRSVHDVPGALAAAQAGADLLLLGTVFPSSTHPGYPASGVALVQLVATAVGVPVIGIGGVDCGNAGQVIEAGAAGVSVVRAVFGDVDPRGAASRLQQTMEQAYAARLEVGL